MPLTMPVEFDVPQHIEQGLVNGQLERVGGVIRDTESKQIIAWLREAQSLTENNPDFAERLQ